MAEKICSMCKYIKPGRDFHSSYVSDDGRADACKSCGDKVIPCSV